MLSSAKYLAVLLAHCSEYKNSLKGQHLFCDDLWARQYIFTSARYYD